MSDHVSVCVEETGDVMGDNRRVDDMDLHNPGEDFKRPWSPLIRMDENVRKKIDQLFNHR